MKPTTTMFVALAACLLLASPMADAGNCLNFDGSNDYIMVPHNSMLSLTNQATFETWIYVTNVSPLTQFFCNKTTYNGNPGGYKVGLWGSKMRLLWGNNVSSYFDVNSTTSLQTNTWYHVAATYDGSSVKWYINGNLDKTSSASVVLTPTADSLLIGRNHTSSLYPFYGSLDRFRIWNYARTQQQIQENMNSVVTPGTPGLVAQWTFNQGTAGGNNSGVTTLYDSSGAYGGKSSPIDGTLRNFALSGSTSNWLQSNAPSAVELFSFDAISEPGAVRLRWATASEQGSLYWLVERSEDEESNFYSIGQLRAAGSSTSPSHYEFTDTGALPGVDYLYRIGEQDINGDISWYGPVRASASRPSLASSTGIKAWPNPFHRGVRLEADAGAEISVYDLTGRKIRSLACTNGSVLWDGLDHNGREMGPSVYFIKAEKDGSAATARITKIK